MSCKYSCAQGKPSQSGEHTALSYHREHLPKEKKYREQFWRKWEFPLNYEWSDTCFQFPYKFQGVRASFSEMCSAQLHGPSSVQFPLLEQSESREPEFSILCTGIERESSLRICKNLLVNINEITVWLQKFICRKVIHHRNNQLKFFEITQSRHQKSPETKANKKHGIAGKMDMTLPRKRFFSGKNCHSRNQSISEPDQYCWDPHCHSCWDRISTFQPQAIPSYERNRWSL